MSTFRIGAALLVSIFLVSIPVFSQSSNGTISGTIADASGAVVPGVTVTATNNATGIVTTVLSNDAGVYNFASLLPGTYKISAALPGFQTQSFNDVQLGNAGQLRLNFALQVGAAAQAVEVTVEAADLITTSSSSVGGVLAQKQVQDLPLVSNNVLDLVGTMGGTFLTNDKVFGAEQTSFAGVSARDVNIQVDGISVNNQRWPNGLETPTKMNPDLVGEIRMILAPVDAEMGRGNGQIQIQMRYGTNAYHGAGIWNVQNSSFDPNTWRNKRNTTADASGVVRPTQRNWRNVESYNLALGGPIKKNKTFFYALWDQQFVKARSIVNATVLTDCARRGIIRYFDNFVNGNSRQTPGTVGAFSQVATVNADGSPKSPDGSPLRYLSVFGALAANPTKPDCSDAQIDTSTLVPTGATSWDPNRKQLDKTGWIASTLDAMPHANHFDNPANTTIGFIPDGLNTATFQWLRRNSGADNLFGAGGDTNNNRRQINAKIDHNFSVRHKINASYSYEVDTSDDAALPQWPTTYFGADVRHPQVLAVNFTSTLSNALLNEARFGLSRTGANTVGSPERADIGNQVRSKMLQVNGGPVFVNMGLGALSSLSSVGYGIVDGIRYGSHEVSPRWVYADSVSWTRGQHSFKFGGEYRLSSTKSTNQGSVQAGANRPTATIGNSVPITSIARFGLGCLTTATTCTTGTPGSGTQGVAENVLTFLAGSLGASTTAQALAQGRFINELKTAWNDYPNELAKIRDIAQNEFGFFFKDDWKATRDLTLNLGVRWDYFGVPWERNGLTTALQGGGNALFGLSGRSFSDWMNPGVRGDLMHIIYVGPNSGNPGQAIYNRDLNNFGPAIGFAYNVPWGGKDKTTVRGGYQIQYTGGGRGFVLDTAIGNPPGSSNSAQYIIPASSPYLDLAQIAANPAFVPVQPLFLPTADTVIPVISRTSTMNAFDPNFATPYIQNVTLSVTRTLSSKFTLDVRYIATLSRKLPGNMDLNSVNFKNNGLKDAFDKIRRGDDTPGILDQMFAGLNIAGTGFGPVGTVLSGVPQTAGLHMRSSPTFAGNLANGNYLQLATTLNTLTNAGATNGGSASSSGSVLRNSGLFPENFIKTNPQVSSAVMEGSLGNAHYHSLQAQFTVRPVGGVSTQTTYTWSRNLGNIPNAGIEGANGAGAAWTDPTNRKLDYMLENSHREHVLVNYGTFDLPFGPQQRLLGNTHGIAARLLENWQTSWVVNLSSGAPFSVTAQSMLYANGVPDVVGPFSTKSSFAWPNGAKQGNLFAGSNGQPLYTFTRDPQCSNTGLVAASLASQCTLNAVQLASTGQIVLQTPLPGNAGTLGQHNLTGLPTWKTDMAIQKRIRITESKLVTVRMDATNVFNHATPALPAGFLQPTVGAPSADLTQSALPFGSFNNKCAVSAFCGGSYATGQRTFQLKARLDF